MKIKSGILLVLLLLMVVASFKAPDGHYFRIPQGWPKPVYDFSKNPEKKETILLGRVLFHDPILSRDNTISCSGCHLPQTAFTHVDHNLSHGIEGRIGTRNSPALMNLAWNTHFMWDGEVNHLDVQALAPISNHNEMDENLNHILIKLRAQPEYHAMFKAAFGDSVITGERTLKALAQFMLCLISDDSKYDRMKRGELEYSESEVKGYHLFQKNCSGCHQEPLFTSGDFENNGLAPDSALNDIGRMKITGNRADSLKFKVPTLRNISVSYPYMHDGRFRNLQMVLFHYTNGIQKSRTLSARLRKPIILTEKDKDAMIAFLKTLTDERFLHNPEYSYRKPG